MTLKDLPVGIRFKTPDLRRKRRVLIKMNNLGYGSHPLTKPDPHSGALYIQHDDKGEIIFVAHCGVRNSSGRRFDMKADVNVIPV